MDIKIDTSVPWGSLGAELKRVVSSWFAIVTKGHKAFDTVDFLNDNTLFFSLRFMIYMGLICFALKFPLLAVFGAKIDNVVFIMATLFFLYVTWLAYASLTHILMKIVGGRGAFKATIAAFCFLSAFMPVGLFIMLIPNWYELKTIDRVPFIIGPDDSIFRYLNQDEKATYLIFFFLGLCGLIYYFVIFYRSLQAIHKTGNVKGFIAFFVSIILILLSTVYLSGPLNEVLIRLAFK